MKILKYIDEALQTRARAAVKFNKYDYIVSKWCLDHKIDVDYCHILGGVESMVNPWSSYRAITDAINNHEEDKW